MLLYHFTDAWPEILAAGAIDATCKHWDSAPLTAHFSADAAPGALPWTLRERRVRIAAEIPEADVHPWVQWATAHGIPPEQRISLLAHSDPARAEQTNQWNGYPDLWYVTERPVPVAEWTEAVDLRTRSLLWLAP
ncbi:hypothetical protein ABZZ36_04045 [Actinacidiphila glaucinigra]|uniref:hypothetical protein n=1 Tax=Actinacidiphila glaucinigra TaxID=235986 RepID=UPI0033B3E71E